MRIGVRIQVVAAILSGKVFSKKEQQDHSGTALILISITRQPKISLKLIQILRLGSISCTHTLFTCLSCDRLL